MESRKHKQNGQVIYELYWLNTEKIEIVENSDDKR